VRPQIIEGAPTLHLDRVRMPGAIATFIGHAIRVAPVPLVHLLAAQLDETHIRIDVEVPGPQSSAQKLEALLDPSPMIGGSEHRGLALGLRLARSVIELHGGFVHISNLNNQGGAAVTVVLPIRGVLITNRPSRPPDSLPPPSAGPSSYRSPPSSGRRY
jgi:K+-sensing histidine kinase KdpD